MKNVLRVCLVAVAVALVGLLYNGCKKDHDQPQWDVELLAPLIKSTLTADKLVADSLMHVAPDGSMSLVYDHDVYSTPVDSIFKINDTMLITGQPWPGGGSTLPSGFTFPLSNNFFLKLNSIELKQSIIKTGQIHLTLSNHLNGDLQYNFTIPKATINSFPFTYSKVIAAAPSGGVVRFDTTFDMSGYWLDLTGPMSKEYNRLDFNVSETLLQPASNIMTGDSIADVKTSFIDLLPIYAKGYLGQTNVTDSATNNINLAKHITGGTLLLDSATISFTIKNSVGADAQATITDMTSFNSKTGDSVDMICADFIGHTLNLNRAKESGPPISPPIPTFYTVTMDNHNSNIVQFLENLPDKISYNIRFSLNPLGDVSGHNDFIYTDSIFTANVKVHIPFRFATNQLTWVDTQSVVIKSSKALDAVGPSTLTLIADNGFPMEMDLKLTTLDANGNPTDQLLVPGTIAAAPIDANYRATGKLRTKIAIPVSAERKANIINCSHMIISASATTAKYPQTLQIYSDYALDIKLIGDVTYRIQ